MVGLYLNTETNDYGTITCTLTTSGEFSPVDPTRKWGTITGGAVAQCDHITQYMKATVTPSRDSQWRGSYEPCENKVAGMCGPLGTAYNYITGSCGGPSPACAGTWTMYGRFWIDLAPTGIWIAYDEDVCSATGPRLFCQQEVSFTSPY